MKVTLVKCHIGVHHYASALTLESEKHGLEMKVLPVGVMVKKDNKPDVVIPFTNIEFMEVEEGKQTARAP